MTDDPEALGAISDMANMLATSATFGTNNNCLKIELAMAAEFWTAAMVLSRCSYHRGGVAAKPRQKQRGEPKPAPHALHSIKAFADQDIHRNAAVLCFAGGGVIAG